MKISKMWFPTLLLVVFMAGCADKNGIIPGAGIASGPTVSSTNPANSATGAAINTKIAATFSEPMDSATITTATFTVTGPLVTPITGTVSYVGLTATFTPASNLATNTAFTATITTGAKNATGTAIAANYTWIFTTGLTEDTTVPTVSSTIPADLATGAAINANITATFSETMDPATITGTTFTLKQGATSVAGAVTSLGSVATFNPTNDLAANTVYTATITTGVKDLAGNALAANKTWSFTTGTTADTTAPTVTITNPANLATNISIDKKVSATFSEPMEPSTMVTTNFTLKEKVSGNAILGTVAYDSQNSIATFLPQSSLTPSTTYVALVATGARDLAGNALVSGLVPDPWEFTTAASPAEPLAINLRGASTFGIASRAGLTSTGVTVVNGDLALYPTATCTDSTGNAGASQTCLVKTYSSPTGMTVNGSIYFAGDPFDNGGTANSVTNDLNIAWTEGMNKVDTQGAIAADEIGGKSFIPGVYHNANLGLAAGGVATLDAQNDANAIFIFKVDSSFVDSGTFLLPSRIDLINGAQARNVWFVTGLDITIGSGTTWNGNILAGRTATILDSSTVNGRVLAGAAGAGAITLTGAATPSVTTINVPQ